MRIHMHMHMHERRATVLLVWPCSCMLCAHASERRDLGRTDLGWSCRHHEDMQRTCRGLDDARGSSGGSAYDLQPGRATALV